MSQRLRTSVIWPRPEQYSNWLAWAQEMTKVLTLKREVEFRGALATFASPLTVAAAADISWGITEYDTDQLWAAAAPTRLTVPRGVRLVRLAGTAVCATAVKTKFFFKKNGSAAFAGNATGEVEDLGTALLTPVLKVRPGDYFEMRAEPASSVNLTELRTWFSLEIVQ